MTRSTVSIFMRENWHLLIALAVTLVVCALAVGRFLAEDYSFRAGGTVTVPAAQVAER